MAGRVADMHRTQRTSWLQWSRWAVPVALLLVGLACVGAAEEEPRARGGNVAEEAGEDGAEEDAGPVVLPGADAPDLTLPSSGERRDVFYNLLQVEQAKMRLAELEAEAEGREDLRTDEQGADEGPERVREVDLDCP